MLRSQLHEARVCATLQVHCCLQLQLLLGNASASFTELLRHSLHMLCCNRCRCFRFQVCCRALQLKVAQPMLLRLLKSQQLQQSIVTQLPISANGKWVQRRHTSDTFSFWACNCSAWIEAVSSIAVACAALHVGETALRQSRHATRLLRCAVGEVNVPCSLNKCGVVLQRIIQSTLLLCQLRLQLQLGHERAKTSACPQRYSM